MAVNIGSAAERPEEAPISRGLWVSAVAVITAALVIAPIAGYRLAVHQDLVIAFFVLMAAADLLTAHLLVQQFLAGGRLATLGLSSAYLYSSMMMVPYAVVFTRMRHWGPDSTWAAAARTVAVLGTRRRVSAAGAAGTWKSDIIATLTHEINQPWP
jgi:hypothetical protein